MAQDTEPDLAVTHNCATARRIASFACQWRRDGIADDNIGPKAGRFLGGRACGMGRHDAGDRYRKAAMSRCALAAPLSPPSARLKAQYERHTASTSPERVGGTQIYPYTSVARVLNQPLANVAS